MKSNIKIWLVVVAVFAGYCIVGADDLRMQQQQDKCEYIMKAAK